ncbi:hypothetical protein BGZ76_005023 [Entomortierella beljakovae]|nr:hypothetical protein BGZ76_005023 [Entomortierella beljakovae]
MAELSMRLDGLSEVTELESIPLPYKTLYHALVVKNDMPIEILQERYHSGSEQLLKWIQAALNLLKNVSDSQRYGQHHQQHQQGQQQGQLFQQQYQQHQLDEEDDEELEAEIQDVVSVFGQYEPSIVSSFEILIQLEATITYRLNSDEYGSDNGHGHDDFHNDSQESLSPQMTLLREKWLKLQSITFDLTASIQEHQRLRDGIHSVRNTSEQSQQATGILEKCLTDIASDRKKTSEIALAEANASRNNSSTSLVSLESSSSLRARARSSGVDSNDMLELDSRIGLLTLQIDTLQKTYPECTRNPKSLRSSKSRTIKQQETGSIAEKKHAIYKLYKELWKDFHGLKSGRDQLWRDLEECDRWRTRVEKMAKQIETMLEPVEIFHKMCLNLLSNLDGQSSTDDLSSRSSQISLAVSSLEIAEPGKLRIKTSFGNNGGSSSFKSEPVDLELLWSTLQELDEKQNMVAPAIENMFWVQEGEIQHRSKTATVSSTSPTATRTETLPTITPPSSDYSPMYPSLDMLERQRNLKNRWSNLKTSLDTVGTKLQAHHTSLKEKAANKKISKKEEVAEDKTLVGSGNSINGGDWNSITSPIMQRPMANGSQRSVSSRRPAWDYQPPNRLFRGPLVSSISMDSPAVRKYMLVASDSGSDQRKWCPSMSVTSPSMPGFPQRTFTWGYFLLSPNEEQAGKVVAARAPPLPTRTPTPAPKPNPIIVNRPPFSPGGNRKYTAFSRPPPTPTRPSAPSRSASVMSENKTYGYVTSSGDPMDWSKTLRKSTSCSNNTVKPMVFGSNSHNTNANHHQTSANKTKRASTDLRSASTGAQRQKSIPLSPPSRCESTASHYNKDWRAREHSMSTTIQSGHTDRRNSLSSVSDNSEDGTIMGKSLGNKSHGIRRSVFKKNESTSSLDSMISSVSSHISSIFGGGNSNLGSSMVSPIDNTRSPSPYGHMFGSSFAAARSSAALHSAYMASMSSSSSASLRQSNSSLSGGESKSRLQHRRERRQQEQVSKMSSASSLSASSWMSMNTGNILSALSFTVPTYSFDEDYASRGSVDESIAAM